MPTVDLSNFLDDDGIDIPNIVSTAHPDGKTYHFASPDAVTGLRLARLWDLGLRGAGGEDVSAELQELHLDPNTWQAGLDRDVMGDTLDEMIADGVSIVRIRRVNAYLFRYFATGNANTESLPGGATAQPSGATSGAETTSPTPATSATPQASPAGSTSHRKPRKPKA